MPTVDRRRNLIGIVSVWLRDIRLIDGGKVAEHGAIGDMRVTEIGRDGQVINANFYPRGVVGFGSVINPEWEYLTWAEKKTDEVTFTVRVRQPGASYVDLRRELVGRLDGWDVASFDVEPDLPR
jgi:hypothetical protein